MAPLAWNVPSSTIACSAGTFSARSYSTWYVWAGENPSSFARSGRGAVTGTPDRLLVVTHMGGDRIGRHVHPCELGMPPRDVHHQPLVQDAGAPVAPGTPQHVVPPPCWAGKLCRPARP